jgi:putrescine aminotransferase
LEPVQGEAGVVIPPVGYLRAVADACADYGAFLIIDEVQTGLGRLGTWFGVDAEGVVPDVLLVAKGLSGGVVPVAAMVATREAYAPFGRDPFLHSSTFAASPLACSAALAAVETMRAEDVPSMAAALGVRLLATVREACAPYASGLVTEVRGRGLLIGIELASQGALGEMVLAMIDRGVLVNHSLNASSVLRLTPPARLSTGEIEYFRSAFDHALAAVAARL